MSEDPDAFDVVVELRPGQRLDHGGDLVQRPIDVFLWKIDFHVEFDLAVPPDNPAYTLRRVWLTEEEYKGYYYGFANEGLWPLCHIAFTRPIFRAADWECYQAVNRKFAEVVIAARADLDGAGFGFVAARGG